MIRQDDMRSIRNAKVICRHTLLMQVVQFFDQRFRIHHHPISNHRDFFWKENPWRNQMQFVLLAVNYNGMAGIVTTLITGNHFGISRKKISDFPFSFISPLGSYNNYWCHNFVWAKSLVLSYIHGRSLTCWYILHFIIRDSSCFFKDRERFH